MALIVARPARDRFRLVRCTFTLLLVTGLGTASQLGSIWPLVWLLPSLAAGAAAELLLRSRERGGFLPRISVLGVPALTLALVVPATSEGIPLSGTAPFLLLCLAVEMVLVACPLRLDTLATAAIAAFVHLVLLGLGGNTAGFLATAVVATLLLVEFRLRYEVLAFPRNLSRTTGFSRRAARSLRRHVAGSNEDRGGPVRVLGPMAAGTMWGALLLFVLLPRVTLEDLTRGGARSGGLAVTSSEDAEASSATSRGRASLDLSTPVAFREDAFLRSVGNLFDDPTPVLRIACRDEDGRAYVPGDWIRIRGIALDTYRRGTWFNTSPYEVVTDGDDWSADGWTDVAPPKSRSTRRVRQEIELEPIGSPAIFGLPELARIELPSVTVDSHGCAAFHDPPTDPVRYRVESEVTESSELELARVRATAERPRYTALPRRFREVERLARIVTQGETTLLGRCLAIESFLQDSYEYTYSFDAPPDADPVEHFLLTRRSGYCVHFASSMIVMLRSLGIPSRMACGYVTDEIDPRTGQFVARNKDAHAWVEAYFNEYGWIGFDPSPPEREEAVASDTPAWLRWLEYLSGFGEAERRALLEGAARLARRYGIVLLVAAVIGAIVVGFVRSRAARRDRVASDLVGTATGVDFYETFLRMLSGRGIRRRPSATPRELARSVRHVVPSAPLELLTESFCAVRYGARTLSAGERGRIDEALAALEERGIERSEA